MPIDESDLNKPNGISFWGMDDNHTFVRYFGSTIEDIINQWRKDVVTDRCELSLCPISLLHNGKRMRIVGDMLHTIYPRNRKDPLAVSEPAILRFIAGAKADEDVQRLLAEGKGQKQ